MAASADLLIVSGGTTTKLMLQKQLPRGERAWRRQRVPRDQPQDGQTITEGTLVWESWHGGDGHGFMGSNPGVQPPVTAEGTLDCRNVGMMRLPPKFTTVAGPVNVLRVFFLAGFLYAVGHDGVNFKVWKLNPNTLVVLTATATTVPITRSLTDMIVFDNNAYLFFTAFTVPDTCTVKIDSAGTITGPTRPDARVATVTRDKLYFGGGYDGIRSVPNGLDPTNMANWSGVLTVAEAGVGVTALAGRSRILYIGLTNGLNAFDTDLNLVSLIPDLRGFPNSNNCRGMVEWHDGVIVPHTRGVYYYSEIGTSSVDINQTKRNITALNITQVSGAIQEGEYLWLMAQMNNRGWSGVSSFRSGVFVVKERTQNEPGYGPLVWYQLFDWANGFVGIPGSYVFATDTEYSAGARLYTIQYGSLGYFSLHNNNMYPRSRIGFDYITYDYPFELTGDKKLPIVNMGAPMVEKYLRSVEIDLDTDNAGRFCTMYYTLNPQDINPTWVSLGSVTTRGRTEIAFPAGTTCREVQLKPELTTNLETHSPAVLRIGLKYAERVTKNTVYVAMCRVGKYVEDLGGSSVQQDPETILERLEGYEDSQTQVTIVNPSGKKRFNALITSVDTTEAEFLDNEVGPVYNVKIEFLKVP